MNNNLKQLFLITLLIGLFYKSLAADIYNYTVDLLFVPALNLQMKISEHSSNCKKLEFVAQTNSVFDTIYRVYNQYVCIYDKQSFQPQMRIKQVNQPKLNLEMTTEYANGKAYYSNGEIVDIPQGTYSFLSLLMYLRSQADHIQSSQTVKVEVKGSIYLAELDNVGVDTIKYNGEKIAVNVIDIGLTCKKHQSVVRESDIFFDNVTNVNGKRIVWIEKNGQRRIIKAKFAVKNTWLIARLKGGDHE